jgi:ribosomal protein S18 acetylase RimI-like enzyme
MEIKRISISQISTVQEIAAVTWPVAFKNILSPLQIDYMLDMMYSEASLVQQFNSGCVFFVLYEAGISNGFASVQHMSKDYFKLHKLYVLPDFQGKSAGKNLLNTVIKYVKDNGGVALYLNVNKYNIQAIEFYKKQSFIVTKEEDIDIGNGYFMNDYVMELLLT